MHEMWLSVSEAIFYAWCCQPFLFNPPFVVVVCWPLNVKIFSQSSSRSIPFILLLFTFCGSISLAPYLTAPTIHTAKPINQTYILCPCGHHGAQSAELRPCGRPPSEQPTSSPLQVLSCVLSISHSVKSWGLSLRFGMPMSWSLSPPDTCPVENKMSDQSQVKPNVLAYSLSVKSWRLRPMVGMFWVIAGFDVRPQPARLETRCRIDYKSILMSMRSATQSSHGGCPGWLEWFWVTAGFDVRPPPDRLKTRYRTDYKSIFMSMRTASQSSHGGCSGWLEWFWV